VQPEMENRLRVLLRLPLDARPAADWKAFEPYTSRSVCSALARVFEQAILKDSRQS
jgi:hypothetical protein